MEQVPCSGCCTFFTPRNKAQKFCSRPACQRLRKALWQKQLLATDPEYKEGSGWHKKNGPGTIPSFGRIIVAGTLTKLIGTVLFKEQET